jgi:hypothetical protein
MKDPSARASSVLERYRTVESLRETEKGRLFETLRSRAVRGDEPRASVDLPPPAIGLRTGLFARFWNVPLAKSGVVGVAAGAAIVAIALTRPKAPEVLAEGPGARNHAGPEADEAVVDEELRLLRHAQLFVRSGDPRRAMALLDEHAAKFPSGRLSDAREVTRMVALCDLGARASAREKAEHFLAQHPASSFSDRVRHICTDPEP